MQLIQRSTKQTKIQAEEEVKEPNDGDTSKNSEKSLHFALSVLPENTEMIHLKITLIMIFDCKNALVISVGL